MSVTWQKMAFSARFIGHFGTRKAEKQSRSRRDSKKNTVGKAAQAPDGGSPPQAASRSKCNRPLQTATRRAARAAAFGGEGPLRVPRRLQPAITYVPALNRTQARHYPGTKKRNKQCPLPHPTRLLAGPPQTTTRLSLKCNASALHLRRLAPLVRRPRRRKRLFQKTAILGIAQAPPRVEARYTRPAGYDSPSTEQPFFLFMGSGSKK